MTPEQWVDLQRSGVENEFIATLVRPQRIPYVFDILDKLLPMTNGVRGLETKHRRYLL